MAKCQWNLEPLAPSKTLANNDCSQNRKLTGYESYTELDGDSGIRAHPRSGPARPHRRMLLSRVPLEYETHELEGAPQKQQQQEEGERKMLV